MRAQASFLLVVYLACSLSVLAASAWLYSGIASTASAGYASADAAYNAVSGSLGVMASLLR